MQNENFKRIDEQAMWALLGKYPNDLTGLILRLAWLQGLMRNEIADLIWEQVDFERNCICLPSREVPMDEHMHLFLRSWYGMYGAESNYVVFSEAGRSKALGGHCVPETISALASKALREHGMKGITLKTLRYDFVARMLEEHEWPYVLSISGYTVTTSRRYSLSTKKGKGTPQERTDESLEEKVQAVLKREGASLEGLVLQLSLQGLTYAEIIALTWEQVDIEARCVRLPNRTIPLQQPLCDALSAYGEEREGEHVFLTPRAKKLWREERLSVQMRNFLVRNGLEGSTVAQLKLALKDGSEKALLLEHARRIGGIDSIEASKLLGVVRSRTTQLINEMINEGKLVRLGSKAYPADTAIHPGNREEGIIKYLKEHGPATHMEIVDLLHAGKRATLDLLTAMVKAGKLRKAGKGLYAAYEDK